jgi:hypothetical protein
MEYDSTRKQVTNVKNTAVSSSSSTKLSQYNPVPYNFNFELYLYVRNIEDGTQIIEHILPYFTPDYTIKLNLVPSMGISKEIPILLNNVDYNIDYEGNETSSTRIIIWTLKFTAKGFVYGAVNEGKVIKKTLVSILNSSNFLPKNQVQFNMSSDGFGRYKIGETVYQGYSLDTASSTASVVSYNTYSNTNVVLLVNNIVGNFTTNTSVIGFDSQAQHNLNSFQIANGVMVLANTTITPANATSNTYFTYVDKITEYY